MTRVSCILSYVFENLEEESLRKKGCYTCLPIAKLKDLLEKGRRQTTTSLMPNNVKELENSLFTFYDDLGKQVGVRYAKNFLQYKT